MAVILVVLFFLVIVGTKIQKDKNQYLSPEVTKSVLGIFSIIIFCSHFFAYIDVNGLNVYDKPLFWLTSHLGQLMVSPFLFFSGYGIFEQYKVKRNEYRKSIPRNRILKVYCSFLVAWIAYAAVSLIFKSGYSFKTYLLSFFAIDSIGNSNWYVLVILLLYFISYVVFFFSQNSKKIAVLIHVLLVPTLYLILFRIGCSSWWYNTLICYLFGVCYSYYKDKIDYFLKQKKSHSLVFLILSFSLFIIFYIINGIVFPGFVKHLIYILTNLCFCLSIVSFLYIFKLSNRILLTLGSSCFWIYILQRIPMIVLGKSSTISHNKYLYLVGCLTLTLTLALVFNKLFNYLWNIFTNHKLDQNKNIQIGIAISYISLFVSVVGGLVVTPIILREIGDIQYGLRSFALSISSWLGIISSALAASYLKFVNDSLKKGGTGEGTINTIYFKIFSLISLFIIILVSIFTIFGFVFNFSFGNYSLSENKLILLILFISSISLAASVTTSVFSHYLIFKGDFIFLRSISLAVSFLTYIVELILVFLTHSVFWLVFGTSLLSIISHLITIIFAFRKRKMQFVTTSLNTNKPIVRQIIIFSSFILLNAIVDQINRQVDITILGVMSGAESVTIYTLSKYFVTYLLTLSVAISGTFAPKIHNYVREEDFNGLNKLFLRVSKSQMLILFLVVGGFVACGRSFLKLWLGDGRDDIYFYAIVLMSLEIIPLSCNCAIEVQRAMNKHKFRAIIYILFSILNVVLTILLISVLPETLSIWGAIFATVFSIGVGNIIILNIYNKVVIGLDMKRYYLLILKYFSLTLVAILPSILIEYLFRETLESFGLFLINGVSFTILYLFELLLFDRKTSIPLLKRGLSFFKL